MKKILKIILAIFTIFIVVGVIGISLIFLDAAGNLATGSQTLPNGAAIGQALVVYDPGLSGGAKDVATKIGNDLQTSGYSVVLAGVKSPAANDLTGYNVIVVGGPIYAGKPASTIQSYLNSLNPEIKVKVGVFGYGGVKVDDSNSTVVMQEVAPVPSGSYDGFSAVVKIVSGDNVDSKCQEFVTNLLK
jgi:flavodoxin